MPWKKIRDSKPSAFVKRAWLILRLYFFNLCAIPELLGIVYRHKTQRGQGLAPITQHSGFDKSYSRWIYKIVSRQQPLVKCGTKEGKEQGREGGGEGRVGRRREEGSREGWQVGRRTGNLSRPSPPTGLTLHVRADNRSHSAERPHFYFCLSKLLAPSLIIGIYYWTHLLPL